MAIKISALDYYLPDDIVTNDELKKENPDWDSDGIEKIGCVVKAYCSPR